MVAMVKVFFNFGFGNFPTLREYVTKYSFFSKHFSQNHQYQYPLGYYEYDACGWLVDIYNHRG
jgi:hypothetical protein